MPADACSIEDAGGYYTGEDVEAALQEIGAGGLHDPVTLAADADTLLGLTGQEIGLDSQAANTVFAGPESGEAADPTFRALVAADIPALGYIAEPQSPEQGDLLYFDGLTWVCLVHGTAGQVLQTGGHGANPSWADAASGGGYAPLTNGDVASPELVFADGDVIMVEMT